MVYICKTHLRLDFFFFGVWAILHVYSLSRLMWTAKSTEAKGFISRDGILTTKVGCGEGQPPSGPILRPWSLSPLSVWQPAASTWTDYSLMPEPAAWVGPWPLTLPYPSPIDPLLSTCLTFHFPCRQPSSRVDVCVWFLCALVEPLL